MARPTPSSVRAAALRTQVTEAQKTNAPNLADLQKQLADMTASAGDGVQG